MKHKLLWQTLAASQDEDISRNPCEVVFATIYNLNKEPLWQYQLQTFLY